MNRRNIVLSIVSLVLLLTVCYFVPKGRTVDLEHAALLEINLYPMDQTEGAHWTDCGLSANYHHKDFPWKEKETDVIVCTEFIMMSAPNPPYRNDGPLTIRLRYTDDEVFVLIYNVDTSERPPRKFLEACMHLMHMVEGYSTVGRNLKIGHGGPDDNVWVMHDERT